MSTYVSVQNRGTIALPPSLRKTYHLDQPGAQVEILEEEGRIVLVPKIAVDSSQAWFWTDEWQAGEIAASHQLANGEGAAYDTAEDFLADLP